MFGSSNYDYRSFYFDSETNFCVTTLDAEMHRRIEAEKAALEKNAYSKMSDAIKDGTYKHTDYGNVP